MSLSLTVCGKQPTQDSKPEQQTQTVSVVEPKTTQKQTEAQPAQPQTEAQPAQPQTEAQPTQSALAAGQAATSLTTYTDTNGQVAYIPQGFSVSTAAGEQTIATGLVVVGPDGSEYVWVPTATTELKARDFGSYFASSNRFSDYGDETNLDSYKAMEASAAKYGGFYLGRYESSKGSDGLPQSKRIGDGNSGSIWVQFSPQDTVGVCERLYGDNETVQGFFPWGANWDTALQWLEDSGNKSWAEIADDSSSWGNYSNDSFSEGARGNTTGLYDEAKSNNIYDLAGNNWEWTQERCGSSYVMRGGGYNLMGGSCPGYTYPAAIRDPLPGNNHHPNVTFRIGLYIQ